MESLTITESNTTFDLSNKTIEKLVVKGNNNTITNLKMDKLSSKCVQLLGDNITLNKCSFNENRKCDVMIQVKGQHCRITNCLFENMNEKGCLIMISVYKNKYGHCLIDNNNFRDMKEGDSNGWEVIRIGDSKSSLYDSKSMIYNNFFHNCDREIELISNKSCANVISFNKIIDCKSGIVLRHGRRCIVRDNYINANHRKGCCGIRVCGKEHTICNNTIEGVLNKSNPFRSSICIMAGELNNKLNGYEPVKHTSIINNDFLSCETVFSLGVHNKRDTQIIPTKLLIEGNRMVKCLTTLNDDSKCIGVGDSFMDNNEEIDRDIRIEIKNGKSIDENVVLEELYRELYIKDGTVVEEDDIVMEDVEEQKEDPDKISDFSDVLEEIKRLKLEEDNSKCEKCESMMKNMKRNKKLHKKKVDFLKKQVESMKKQLNDITKLLF